MYNAYLLLTASAEHNWDLLVSKDIYQVRGVLAEGLSPVSVILRSHSSDFSVFRTVMLNKEYRLAVYLFNDLLKFSPKVIVDAGANIGLSTLFFKSAFPSASVICIEPESSNYLMLDQNITANKLSNVHSIQAGLWNRRGYLKIDRTFRDGMEWSVRVLDTNEADSDLKAIDIPYLFERYGIHHIDIFKIDIEGSEKVLFENSHFELFLNRITCVMIEIHPEFISKEYLMTFFIKRNFSIMNSGKETMVAISNKVIGSSR